MPISFSLSAFSDSRWYEYVVRFVLGGFATVVTGILSALYGESIGGLFLALPAIFCASATLIERHEIRRKREAGLDGTRRGQTAAALDAAGSSTGKHGHDFVCGCASHIGATRPAARILWRKHGLGHGGYWRMVRETGIARRAPHRVCCGLI